ncbi:uncharacterized protein V6R79_015383 [Siganus canaliculatus]
MKGTRRWPVAFLVIASFTFLAEGARLEVMSAPNLLRVGTAENIFVECQDCTGGDIPVQIYVRTHPAKAKLLASKSVTLNSGNNYQALVQIKIPVGDFSRDPSVKQYVYLQAQFPNQLLEKVVLASFQSGYIFIQTDKTLYTPNSKVHYRMFGLTPTMEPVERDNETQSDASISIEFKTPDDIIIPRDPVSLKSGIHSGDFLLPELVSFGVWTVIAKFHSNPQQSYSAKFEVKEYVLPSFEVKLTPVSPFYYVDSTEFTVNIKATYLFGKEVDGAAYVVFGVMEGKGEGNAAFEKTSLPASLQRVEIAEGKGEVTLKKEHITNTFPNIMELVDKSLYVAVSVLTESGSEMVEATLRHIAIVTSPYKINFKKTPTFYKPGMSFDVAVEVLDPNDQPAAGVAVQIEPGQTRAVTSETGLARLTVNTAAENKPLTIKVKTQDNRLREERQTSAQMVAKPYESSSNSFIHIGLDAAQLELDDSLKISFVFNKQISQRTDITYLILSRGRLVQSGRSRVEAQSLISERITITKEMIPSFRIIAYYHTSANEVVSDSVWVDVEDDCMGSLKLESTRTIASYEPRKMFGLKVTGDPGATVGLVAVDKGVYVLNNEHRLTQKKVWNIVEGYDPGCTAGSGKNAISVFFDAGLVFESSALRTPYRQDLKCVTPSRSKRSPSIAEITTNLTFRYKGLERDCCVAGMTDTPLSYTCERRSEYIGDGAACVAAFLTCCRRMENERAERREENLQLARSDDDDSYMDSSEIVSRSKFPESWLWSDIILPACPKHSPNCDTTYFVKNVPLQDSITTWQFTGISLSTTLGICVSKPLEVIVKKEFFIDLRLPYSAVRGEQIEIKAILHNYSPDLIDVRVELLETAQVCSSASKRGKYRQEVKVGPETTRSVPFVIIPMKEGDHRIEVKAAVKDSSLYDGIYKMLRVVPEGVLMKHTQIVLVDPRRNGVGGKQETTINSAIPQKDLAPNTPTSTHISVTGKQQLSSLVENAISGKSMGSLIIQPSGCGEQNLAAMTLPVIAATYLDRTKQWETVGFQRRPEALQHINTGYVKELTYRKEDGSFAVFTGSKGSTWLTAYAAKVFAMANDLVAIQRSVICDAVKFLILKTQNPDGSFSEIGDMYSDAMRGGVQSINSGATMTAFCVVTLQETRPLCASYISSLIPAINKAVSYLERQLPSLNYPYAVAMTSYALANERKLNREILYKFVSPELDHWKVNGRPVFTLEATAYALLALVKVEAFEDAAPIVRWFRKQQWAEGGYGSTQATIMVYQALAEYFANANEPDYDLNVDLVIPGRSKPDKWKFNRENHYATRSSKMNEINQDVKVVASGSGEATVKMVSLYYALPKEKESDCQNFNLSVQLLPEKPLNDEKTFKVKIEVFYKDKERRGRDATMTIVDIGLLTGFRPNTDDLTKLSKGPARTISKFEFTEGVLTDRGSLVIYLDKVSHRRPEEISFRIHQTLSVGVLQPAAVSVYEYYDQTPCVKFYHPERAAGQLLQLCRNDECTCAEENCSMQKKGEISNEERTDKACETEENNKIDYVYKVRMEAFTRDLSIDIYKMRVIEVIKEGSSDVGPAGQSRDFLSYPHCDNTLGLKAGKTYLIMGSSRDIYRDEQTRSFQYVLGERTWIEYWPTEDECQNDEHRPTCFGMEELVQQYALFGCLN